MLKPVLLILHQEHSSPGRVGQVLAKLGYPLDIRRPRFGDPLPETMDEHAGAAIFGGPQSANDDEDFVRREIDWIGVVRCCECASKSRPPDLRSKETSVSSITAISAGFSCARTSPTHVPEAR